MITVNGEASPAAETLGALLMARGIDSPRGVAVAVNGEVVPAGAWAATRLGEGDAVEIVRPFGGG